MLHINNDNKLICGLFLVFFFCFFLKYPPVVPSDYSGNVCSHHFATINPTTYLTLIKKKKGSKAEISQIYVKKVQFK